MDPSAILATWASGLGAGGALVIRWRIVGPGFARLVAGITAALAAAVGLAGGGPGAWTGVALAALALLLPRAPVASVSLLGAAVGLGWTAATGGIVIAVTGAWLLGGVSAEMLLGHWYLVDPRLPRSALRTLAVIGLLGAAAEAFALPLAGDMGLGPFDVGWMILLAATALLMVAVWGALREPGYAGVMAATGLSYLALLTAVAAAVLVRAAPGG